MALIMQKMCLCKAHFTCTTDNYMDGNSQKISILKSISLNIEIQILTLDKTL